MEWTASAFDLMIGRPEMADPSIVPAAEIVPVGAPIPKKYGYMMYLQDGYRPSGYREYPKYVQVHVWGNERERELIAVIGRALEDLAKSGQFDEFVRVADGINRRGVFEVTSNHSQIVLEADRRKREAEAKLERMREEKRRAEFEYKKFLAECEALRVLAVQEMNKAKALTKPVYCVGCNPAGAQKWEVDVEGDRERKLCSACLLLEDARTVVPTEPSYPVQLLLVRNSMKIAAVLSFLLLLAAAFS